jgi:hypothetical protein
LTLNIAEQRGASSRAKVEAIGSADFNDGEIVESLKAR